MMKRSELKEIIRECLLEEGKKQNPKYLFKLAGQVNLKLTFHPTYIGYSWDGVKYEESTYSSIKDFNQLMQNIADEIEFQS